MVSFLFFYMRTIFLFPVADTTCGPYVPLFEAHEKAYRYRGTWEARTLFLYPMHLFATGQVSIPVGASSLGWNISFSAGLLHALI